jgi:hypothetical protein
VNNGREIVEFERLSEAVRRVMFVVDERRLQRHQLLQVHLDPSTARVSHTPFERKNNESGQFFHWFQVVDTDVATLNPQCDHHPRLW